MKRILLGVCALTILNTPHVTAAKPTKGDTTSGTISVNCSGQSLQSAIDNNTASLLTIKLVGSCYEDIRIIDRSVTIEGSPTASIIGPAASTNGDAVVSVSINSGVRLKDITVKNSGSNPKARGFSLYRAAGRLQNVTVTGFPSDGAFVVSSNLTVIDSVFSQNVGAGINALHHSFVEARNSTFESNRTGLHADQNSTSYVYNSLFADNGDGIKVTNSSSLSATCDNHGPHLKSNSWNGVNIGFGSSAFLNSCENTVSSADAGGYWVHGNSSLELRGGTISGGRHGIDAVRNSSVLLVGSPSFSDHSWVSVAISDSSTLNQPENDGELTFETWGASGSKAIRVAKGSSATLKRTTINGYDGPSVDVQRLSDLELRGDFASAKGSPAPDILVRDNSLLHTELGISPLLANGIFCESFSRAIGNFNLNTVKNNGRCNPPENF